MQKDLIELWAKYNRVANEAMNGFIKTLGSDEWNRPLGGFFASVHSLCSHIYIADFNWLKRFKNLRGFAVLDGGFFEPEHSYKELLFEDTAEYLSARPLLDDKICAFAAELRDEDLAGDLKYTASEGRVIERNSGGLLMQMFNHETHHRGMISLYLEILGRENDFSSFGRAL